MNAWLSYIFWPNPGNAHYDNPKVMALLVMCLLLVVASFALSRWRNGLANPSLKKVSKSWSGASFWFGVLGILLTVARVEQIQFLAMRFLWFIWFACAVLFVVAQVYVVRTRTYEVLPSHTPTDDRAKYLPKRKRH